MKSPWMAMRANSRVRISSAGLWDQALAALALVVVPTQWINHVYGRAFWEVGGARVWAVVPFVAAYLFGAAYLSHRLRRAAIRGRDLAMPVLLLAATAVMTYLLPREVSTAVILLSFTGSVALLLMFFGIRGYARAKALLVLIVVLAATGIHAAYAMNYLPRAAKAEESQQSIGSSLYAILAHTYRRPVPAPMQSGGALAMLWNDYLLAIGDGTLYRFSEPDSTGELPLRKLELRIPTNPDAFRAAAEDLGIRLDWFRVADIATQLTGDTVTLFASHHYWDADASCYTVRVSSIALTRSELDGSVADRGWKTIFESAPCLSLTLPETGKPFFGGLQIGGRMALRGPDTLLVTIGDHEFDGVTAPIAFAQDLSVSYGKVFAIDLRNGSASVFTVGHRNPQGLFVDSDGAIWSTEHGPRGGDELNRLEAGRNYGWPNVTYGVHYGTFAWPFNKRQGAHDGYEAPIYAWVPSVGISSVLKVSNSKFVAWQGDLLAGSLERMALWRIRLDGGRVVVAEPIELGIQVRDMIEGHEGRIIIWSERYPGPFLVFLEPDTRNDTGSMLFVQCTGCHTIGNGRSHGIGPDLAGVSGRRIASGAGYTYSEALRQVAGSWTMERLDAFLENPEAFAPGTTMRFGGISDPNQRRALIEYLRTAKRM